MKIDGAAVSLEDFFKAMRDPTLLCVSPEITQNIKSTHAKVIKIAQGAEPVYGLNTGLGANFEHRIPADKIAEFQIEIIAGRAVACGDPLDEDVGRGAILSRIITASLGYSGMSPTLFEYLCSFYQSGLSPVVPEFGSVGASDLLQNAHIGMALCGLADVWDGANITDAKSALEVHGIKPPELQHKDGLSLISHSGTSIAMCARALMAAKRGLFMMKLATLLSYEGYGANQDILCEKANTLRKSPGQAQTALWFRNALSDSKVKPRRIQEALSFRTVAVTLGAGEEALSRAILIFEDELNGCPDSPVILDDETMLSTANFLTPALALAIENLSLSLVSVAHSSVQRMQKMMNSSFSDLPHYLAPLGARAAGFVPSQKTAASLFAEIKLGASPAMPDAAPISDGVEDMVATTLESARKLLQQIKAFEYLASLEALVASQAIDLRGKEQLGGFAKALHTKIREEVAFADHDRMLGGDIETLVRILRQES